MAKKILYIKKIASCMSEKSQKVKKVIIIKQCIQCENEYIWYLFFSFDVF